MNCPWGTAGVRPRTANLHTSPNSEIAIHEDRHDAIVDWPPSQTARRALTRRLQGLAADLDVRLEEVALRAEALQLVGDEVGAQRAIAEHDLLLDEYRALAQRAIRSAVVEREMETVIAAAEGLKAPVHTAAASPSSEHPVGSRRVLSGVASVVALVAAVATLVVGQGEPDVELAGPLVNATADASETTSATPRTTPSPGGASEAGVAGATPTPTATTRAPVGTPGATSAPGTVVAGEGASRTLAEQMIDTVAEIVADLEQAAADGLDVVTDELPDVDPDFMDDFVPDDAESSDEPARDGSPSLSADDDSSADVEAEGSEATSSDASADDGAAAEDGAFVQEPAAE